MMCRSKNQLRVKIFLILLIVSGIGLCSADEEEKTLIAIYASGGSLEQESGLITDDFLQMIQGFEKNASERIILVAAYGGADKPGWQGMRIASYDELKQDLKDGELGSNNTSILYFPDANMGDPASLTLFLSHVYDNYQFDRIFLIFIGHGQAYTGMLFDQNHDEDGLTIEELRNSLATGPWDIDLIGFDSCLMGCLEMISALSPYASFIIASEESVPAEGWPYEPWFSYLSSHPDGSIGDYARSLSQEYMKNPGQGKTIALINPKQADLLTSRLDQLASDLFALAGTEDGRISIKMAINATQQFGLTGTGDLDEATMDLYSFAENIGQSIPYLADSSDEVIEAINQTVVFAKHDERVPGAHGIAVLSPVLINPVFFEYYRESAFITPSWDRFLMRYLDACVPEAGKSAPLPVPYQNQGRQ